MTVFDRLHLHSPWLLLLLPLILFALVVGLRRRFPALTISSVRPFKRQGPSATAWRWMPRLPRLLEGFGILLLLVALIRPQLGIEETVDNSQGIDIILALDCSGSMQAVDTPNRREAMSSPNRLEVAKQEVGRFIERRPDDRIGLLAFSGESWTACPPTLDHDFLLGRLKMLEPGMFQNQNTNVAGPLAMGTLRLKDSTAKRRVLVLFTDGANNVQDRISPTEAGRIATKFDIIVHTVGIGSTRSWAPARDGFGRVHWVQMDSVYDEALMKELASLTGGQFFPAADKEGFSQVMDQIDELETIELEQTVYRDYQELYRPWLSIGLAVVMLALILEFTVFLKVP